MRFIGLGGAFVGLADDASAGRTNPAGHLTLPRSMDIVAGGGGSWSNRGNPWFFALAIRPQRYVAGSFRVGGTPRERLSWLAVDQQPESRAPFGSVSTVGAAIAVRTTRRLSAGASIHRQRLSLRAVEGLLGEPDGRVGSRDSSWSGTFGALFRSDNPEAPRVGLAYRHRIDVDLDPVGGATGPAATRFRVRTPPAWSAGVSWHYDFRATRLLFTYQQDLVRYSELRRRANLPAPHDEFEFRLGAELSFPLFRDCYSGCGSMLQLRAAIISRAQPPFTAVAGGLSPAGQGPPRQTSWFAGLSYAGPKPLAGRVKFEAAYSHATRSLMGGVGFRYPQSHRGDLADSPAGRRP